jgi:hypothetical protein
MMGHVTKEELADVVKKVILEKLGEYAGRPNSAVVRAAIRDQVLEGLKALDLPVPEQDVWEMFLNRVKEVPLEGDLIPARTPTFDGRYEDSVVNSPPERELTVADVQAAVESLRRNNVPPFECPSCKRRYYVSCPKGWTPGDPIRLACGCGKVWRLGDGRAVLCGTIDEEHGMLGDGHKVGG